MANLINGLHHVTAIASAPQANVDFYAGILGLRLLKKTVNFDAPDVYHLYYGDETGSPGSIMTFFPFGHIQRGRRGAGQMSYTAFSVPDGALNFWMERLKKFNITFEPPARRFNEEFIRFDDNDGLGIELVATANDARPAWISASIPPDVAIRGFYTATLQERTGDRTIDLLTNQMQHRLLAQEGDRYRFEAGAGGAGNYVDIIAAVQGGNGLQGAGTIHHLAFSTDTSETQLAIRDILLEKGLEVTPVIDRQYFHSIYYREPGGILFEIATNPPGFAVDEDKNSLGTSLKLPPQYEAKRALIEQHLEPIAVRAM
ncbi:MAG: ring-cleaving dioxygenase [Candidatus Kapabacteria bacterium]|nr:ring-cleaving dioxygenase [Candidatus Kapabacteria bacterium]